MLAEICAFLGFSCVFYMSSIGLVKKKKLWILCFLACFRMFTVVLRFFNFAVCTEYVLEHVKDFFGYILTMSCFYGIFAW